jgi:ribosomal-protein-alanine N-acetyltransferase
VDSKLLAAHLLKLEQQGTVSTWALGDYERELDSQSSQLFLWPENSGLECQAFVLFRQVADTVSVMQWAVGNKGQGLGLLVFQSFLEWLRQNSIAKRVELEVRAGNLPALAIYKRLGFTPGRLRKDYYGPGQDGWELALQWV